MTTFYFGRVNPEDFNEYLEPDTLFTDGVHHYWYKAEVDLEGEGFTLWDTCDRHFPVGFEHGRDLGTVLFGLNKIGDAVEVRNTIVEKAVQEATLLVEHFQNNP